MPGKYDPEKRYGKSYKYPEKRKEISDRVEMIKQENEAYKEWEKNLSIYVDPVTGERWLDKPFD